ncbi:MAG: hypothetical protein IPM93_19965 [Candidatus Obscuribacter sp.]|nr:hypothetical protein [Candidatus Obscuribacter sp.]
MMAITTGAPDEELDANFRPSGSQEVMHIREGKLNCRGRLRAPGGRVRRRETAAAVDHVLVA